MELKKKDGFENVFIFVSDSLRYDSAISEFDRQQVIKTVASGISSPPGFASILTGKYPTQHGVLSFNNKLDSSHKTIFDLCKNSSFYNEGKELGKVLGTSKRLSHESINNLEPPFVYFERDLIPHAPYNYSEEEYDGSVRDYCSNNRKNASQDYDDSVTNSIKKFEKRVDVLRDRGLLEDTLIIFTADHGEVLGDHGFYGHGYRTVPELVYVPTVFYNNSLGHDSDMWMGQVDILPTVAELLNKKSLLGNTDGCNLLSQSSTDRIIFNQHDDTEWSLWDESGGYLFTEKNLLYRLGWWGYLLTKSSYSPLNRNHAIQLMNTAIKGWRSGEVIYGEPGFGRNEAKKTASNVFSEKHSRSVREQDEIDKEHLEDLGYINQ
ncbi:sulfatase-like hydrolase/transferase [Natronococcus sp. JC468]|uniref:sulfatase-like hydrolase/transferase n=1 Tax=Natronococcus sp. JC468 TaxID=1961921 RepID=UPI00143A83C0|nr:sulfatase-like hydrolase/transferase [Natronococcus sp. JC468]NKE36545.1 sulfatase-like hydrolase/transferase [Natronococcus sp. JC468]